MKYVYLSSGQFGAKVLTGLTPRPSLVITQPDRLGGRGMKTLISTPVKQICQELGIPYQENLEINWSQFDFALVADFGIILPEELLEQTKHGFWNIHPSLLPKYRGTSPLQTVILNNESETGVSLIKLDAKMDHGPIIGQETLPIVQDDTYLTLLDKTATIGAKLFNRAILTPIDRLTFTEQDHTAATFTKKLTKKDGFVPVEQLVPFLVPIFKRYNLMHLLPASQNDPLSPAKLKNLVRALSPWPGVWTKSDNKVIKINLDYIEINGHQYRSILF